MEKKERTIETLLGEVASTLAQSGSGSSRTPTGMGVQQEAAPRDVYWEVDRRTWVPLDRLEVHYQGAG